MLASLLLLPTAILLLAAADVEARYDPMLMLCAVNRIRRENGLPALGPSAPLDSAAQRHSNYQASVHTMTHSGQGGSDPAQRVEQAGYHWMTVAENVAYGYDDQTECLDAWMRSPGHRENILKPDITHMGSAVGYAGSTPYYTQDFAGDGRKYNFPECPSGGDNYPPQSQPQHQSMIRRPAPRRQTIVRYSGPQHHFTVRYSKDYSDDRADHYGDYPEHAYPDNGGRHYGRGHGPRRRYRGRGDRGHYPAGNYNDDSSCSEDEDYGHDDYSRHAYLVRRSPEPSDLGHGTSYWATRSGLVDGASAADSVALVRRSPEYEDDGVHGRSSWTQA